MVLQRRRSLIAWLQPVLPEVTARISERSTLCVSRHSPRASQPRCTSEMLAQCGNSRGCWQEDLQMGCKEERSVLCTASQGFQFGTGWGIRIFYIHPALCRGMSTTPVNLHTASLHHKQLSPLPVLPAGKRGTEVLQQVSGRAWGKVVGAAPAPCSLLCSPPEAPTAVSLCPCPQPSQGTAQRKVMLPASTSLAPGGPAREGCFGLWIFVFMSLQ